MNAKSKKYYQVLCQLNKENKQNAGSKIQKNKPSSEKDISYAVRYQGSKHFHLLPLNQNKNSVHANSYSVNHQLNHIAKSESKRNIFTKPVRESRECDSNNKEKNIKLPKIAKQQLFQPTPLRRKHSKSYKKIMTEPNSEEYEIDIRTLSPKENMKQVLLNIVKNKENRHLASIDEQIQKLDSLTKRYSCLRKDLVLIQEDILTISFKQKCRQKGRQTSQSNSVVFM